MKETDFSIRISGEAGHGIASSGLALARIAQRSGYFIFDYSEYPSLIRGGHNVYTARIAGQPVFSPRLPIQFLIALNQDAIDLNKNDLDNQALVLVNSDKVTNYKLAAKIKALPAPLIKIALDNNGSEVMMNNVALGIASFLLRVPLSVLEESIKEAFSWASPEIIMLNINIARKGFEYAEDNFADLKVPFNLQGIKTKPKLFLSGNDAFCLGAIKVGCKFFSAYPMTPINSMIAYFAAKAKELDLIYFQPEDEISAINSALGAAVCGVKAMTASSGGGFSLMVEALGMAGMAEIPLVIIEGQRTGPSSGMPTWSGQGDLRFVLHASQDDFPRVVLAPGDAAECFEQIILAFNLAEKYQLPVILLTDKYLGESRQTIDLINEDKIKIERGKIVSLADSTGYKRYQFSKDGVSPRAFIGQTKEPFFTTSYEHNELGFADESSENRKAMTAKRMQKLKTLEKEMTQPLIFGDKTAQIGLISWGSNKGVILESQKILESQGVKTSFLHLNFLNPFPKTAALKFCQNKKQILLLEQNISAQLAGLIREKIGVEIKNQFLKYDGRPFYPDEIVAKVKEIYGF